MASETTAGAIAPVANDQGVIWGFSSAQLAALGVLVAFLATAPFFLYPVFLMKLLCFALFACAFNLLIGYVGLLSFGHAAYFGMGGYIAGYTAKAYGFTPNWLCWSVPPWRVSRAGSSAGSPSAGRASTSR